MLKDLDLMCFNYLFKVKETKQLGLTNVYRKKNAEVQIK